MTAHRTMLVDIGNSAVKLAAQPAVTSAEHLAASDQPVPPPRGSAPLRMLRTALGAPDWEEEVVRQARSLLIGDGGLAAAVAAEDVPLRWVVASVNGHGTRTLRQRIAARSPQDKWVELGRADVPIGCELRNPAGVGIDRLLGAVAAWRRGGGSDVIAIDAGSAVTVDLVQQGIFRGGAILPGLRLQLSSLARGTDLLPDVAKDAFVPLEIPGRDTTAAMRTGVMLGVAGAIDRLIERYTELCADRPRVFLTGGDAAALEPLLGHSATHCDGLVLSGLSDVASALGYDG